MKELESKLDSFDQRDRAEALAELADMARSGKIELPESGSELNLHCHTFFSYNSYGYSPSKFAWLARKAGLSVAGVVEFDVLDSLDEFYEACALLGLKGTVGLETRVYIPEFADREITSPGEPGVSYHMGIGFPRSDLQGSAADFQKKLRNTVQDRNSGLMERVNKYLDPVVLDYEEDILSLTPSGNATERHMCLAYARKAREMFPDDGALAEFWSGKLEMNAGDLDLPEGKEIQAAIRKKTMKRGGVGYVQPDKGSFPSMTDMNFFTLECGAIPTHTWLDGSSAGEQAIEELLDVSMAAGAEAINLIPDRNYTAGLGDGDEKSKQMYKMIKLANERDLIVVMGTEMNSPGQKFVDDFGSAELAPLKETFLRGAHILYAHTVLQRKCGLGCTSEWARGKFGSAGERNAFFEELGRTLMPQKEGSVACFGEDCEPKQLMETIRKE